MRSVGVVILIFCSPYLLAQDILSVWGNVGLTSNPDGVLGINAEINYNLKNNYYVGLIYDYTYSDSQFEAVREIDSQSWEYHYKTDGIGVGIGTVSRKGFFMISVSTGIMVDFVKMKTICYCVELGKLVDVNPVLGIGIPAKVQLGFAGRYFGGAFHAMYKFDNHYSHWGAGILFWFGALPLRDRIRAFNK